MTTHRMERELLRLALVMQRVGDDDAAWDAAHEAFWDLLRLYDDRMKHHLAPNVDPAVAEDVSRAIAGRSIREAARELGVPKSTLYDWLTRSGPPSALP